MTTHSDTLDPAVRELIDRYVAALIADAPAPTEEQVTQLRRWFGPCRGTQQTPRRHADAA